MILRITKFYDKTNNRKTYFNYHVITTMIYTICGLTFWTNSEHSNAKICLQFSWYF